MKSDRNRDSHLNGVKVHVVQLIMRRYRAGGLRGSKHYHCLTSFMFALIHIYTYINIYDCQVICGYYDEVANKSIISSPRQCVHMSWLIIRKWKILRYGCVTNFNCKLLAFKNGRPLNHVKFSKIFLGGRESTAIKILISSGFFSGVLQRLGHRGVYEKDGNRSTESRVPLDENQI